MPDVINILPDSIANQIAAGEVIQKPASAVKELMENAVDAAATQVRLIIKDAGKTLIQITDDGCGMSETDARLCFERHATSKINCIDDLFAIRTMGFRGEALASIASIAQVEMKTKRVEDEVGTYILIEGCKVKSQEPSSCNNGTSIALKNIFYNVPARRNFLKSNATEMRNIIEEFHRVALAHPTICFTLHNNDVEVYRLKAESLRQRIVTIFGADSNQKLVPVQEETDFVKLNGFIGKPDFAKKTRGEQYFFVNNRFIKNAYLNHAVVSAYENMLPPESFPLYILNVDIDPKEIDINVHPTKTEIKFQEERNIYAIIRSAVKHALGKYNITPTLDFDQERSMSAMLSSKPDISRLHFFNTTAAPKFNPFQDNKQTIPSNHFNPRSKTHQDWEKLYKNLEGNSGSASPDTISVTPVKDEVNQLNLNTETSGTGMGNTADNCKKKYVTCQLHNSYILTPIKSGLMIIDQQAAHERILYEKFLQSIKNNSGFSQKQLFPQPIEISSADYELVMELLPEFKALGFDIQDFGNKAIVVNGVPAEITEFDLKETMECLLEQYKQNLSILKLEKHENLACSLAKNSAIKSGKSLSSDEMDKLIDNLFACKMPNASPNGNNTIVTIRLDELAHKFKKTPHVATKTFL